MDFQSILSEMYFPAQISTTLEIIFSVVNQGAKQARPRINLNSLKQGF
jgi:hypothetical protein